MNSFFRFLKRNPLYTFINVVGLAVSLMFVILIGDYTWRQFSIDSWHKKRDRIVLLGHGGSFFSWPDATRQLGERYPEIEKTCCVMTNSGSIRSEKGSVTYDDGDPILLADQTFFDLFDFRLVQGDRATAFDAPDKCVITESLARTLFPGRNPMGEALRIVGNHAIHIGDENPHDTTLVYTVSAVARDFDKTVLPNDVKIIASMDRHPQVMGYTVSNNVYVMSGHGATKSFLLLREGADLTPQLPSISEWMRQNVPALRWFGEEEAEATLTPLTKLMFAPQNDGRGMLSGDRGRLTILLSAILAILLFAIINYVNLTVANTGLRSHEMATRRLLGNTAGDIALKLMGESTLMVLVSFLLGLGLAFLVQYDMATLFRGKIALQNDVSAGTISVCAAFILVTGLLSGIIPAMQLAKYKPIDVVKGTFRYRSKMVLSRVFIIVQNVVTVVMLVAMLTIRLQLSHLVNAPLGFNTKDIYFVAPDNPNVLRGELEALPFVERIGTFSGSGLVGQPSSMTSRRLNDGEPQMFYLTKMDRAAMDIYGLKVLADYGNTEGAYYVNQEAMRRLGLTDADREIVWGDESDPIAGVVADFHSVNILADVRPYLISVVETDEAGTPMLNKGFYKPYFIVKTDGSSGVMERLRNVVAEVDGSTAQLDWKVQSLEAFVAETFDEQQNTLRIVSLFTLVAVIIAVLGFTGLSLFFIRQRRKEIGVRRVMGSTEGEVAVLMLRRFCAPLLVSFVVAVPVAWYIMRGWLDGFAYRIALSWWIFAAACGMALLFAVLSIIVQILRATRINPAVTLRQE